MLGRFFPGFSVSLLLPLFSLSVAAICSAQGLPNVEPTPRERTLLAESFTSERLSVWQKRLNLQDWNISVIMSHANELKPKTLGNIHWDLDKKTATIRVL